IDGNPGDLLFAELEEDRHRLERPPALAHALLENCALIGTQLQHLDDDVEHLLPVAGPFAGHGQTETWAIVGNDYAVAVENQPAGRRDRLHVDAIVFRQRGVVLVLDHLQIVQTRDQRQGQPENGHGAHDDAPPDQAGILFVVLERYRLRHRRRQTAYL